MRFRTPHPFLIWSNEHGAWWGPNSRGYTRSIGEAGRYTGPHAKQICDESNVAGRIDEVAVLCPQVIAELEDPWSFPVNVAQGMMPPADSPRYSAGWLQRQAWEKGARILDHHACALCGTWVKYLIWGDYKEHVAFDSTCDCTTLWSPAPDEGWQPVADWLAAQPSDEHRDRIMTRLK